MAWNGSGTFTRTNGDNNGSNTWQQDEADGDKITSTRHDTHDQDLADGINACLAKNGENAMSGNLDLGGNSITNADDISSDTLQVVGLVAFSQGPVNIGGNANISGKLIVTTTAPSTASSTGTTGQIASDADYIYICTASNTWKRVAIATW